MIALSENWKKKDASENPKAQLSLLIHNRFAPAFFDLLLWREESLTKFSFGRRSPS
jgi:hypothetical protein